MKKFTLSLILVFLCGSAFGASIGFEGSARTEASYFNKLGLGRTTKPVDETKAFILGRMLLEPSIVVDDHFTIYSLWTLLATSAAGVPGANSTIMTPGVSTGMGNSQYGYIYGDNTAMGLILSRAWLEWTFDFGTFMAGRMPFSWGYGLVWDAGDIWDDFQTTLDRLVYSIHLGNLTAALAYSKPLKNSVLGNNSDQDFYMFYIQYINPETEIEFGALYERQIRSDNQQPLLNTANVVGGVPGTGIPPDMPVIIGTPSLAGTTPYPLNNHMINAYIRKTFKRFTLGGEISWITGDATDLNGDKFADDLNAFAAYANITYEYHQIKAYLNFLYASGDDAVANGSLDGFVLLHRNKRPGIILGHELLGSLAGDDAGLGSVVAYGSAPTSLPGGVFSGAIYAVPGFSYEWAQSWRSGIEIIWAQKAKESGGAAKDLGVEIDVATDYQVHKNAVLGLVFGFLIAGDGLGVPSPKNPLAFKGTLGLVF